MNQSKIKYLKQRVDETYNDKRATINLEYKKVAMSADEKLEALKEGRFTFKDSTASKYGHYIEDFVVFEEAPEPDTAERDAKLAELLKKKTELLDEIVLGDEENALQLLRGFAGD
jgi:hypothetical protein